MKRQWLFICILVAAVSICSKVCAENETENSVVLFFTGNELGQLKPCGCSGGQLGGLERRMAVFNTAPTTHRLIVETGSFIENYQQQDLIKFNIIVQALAILQYDVVNLDAGDVETAEKTGLLDAMNGIYNILNCHRPNSGAKVKFTRSFLLNQKEVPVTIAAFDASSGNTDGIYELFEDQSQGQRVNILILNHCDETILAGIKDLDIIDAVICPKKSDKPMIIGRPEAKPLVFSVGQFGRYIAKLTIAFDAEGKFNFDFSDVPVTQDLAQQKDLIDLYKNYQGMVKQANLLENVHKYPLAGGLEYIGTNACAVCHEHTDKAEIWRKNKHSKAFETLEKAGSQFDPECVICHVVGLEQKTGYINQAKSDYLKDVGCEACHRPGSEHLRTLGKAKMPERDPRAACLRCHTPDHSGEFAGKKMEYFAKIKHWREPKIADEVKIDEQKNK